MEKAFPDQPRVVEKEKKTLEEPISYSEQFYTLAIESPKRYDSDRGPQEGQHSNKVIECLDKVDEY